MVKDFYREVELVKQASSAAVTLGLSSPESAVDEKIELSVSFVEIYMEQIRDLLVNGGTSASAASGGLKIRENAQRGIFIEELSHSVTPTESSMMELIKTGVQNRAVASTRMNKDSSRSHTILTLNCSRKDAATPRTTRRSTMYIVDLAGSEFVNKTNASGKVLQEAKAINKSLSALSNVIKALVEGKKHVPYRDSKLTRILQDSLGGAAKTCLILAASCSSYNIAETISTLRFGLRAKEIKNPAIAQRNEAAICNGVSAGGGSTGTNGGNSDAGSVFKELYQRAMEDVESRNRTIDELQRLLAAKQEEENQHLEAQQPQAVVDDLDDTSTRIDCSNDSPVVEAAFESGTGKAIADHDDGDGDENPAQSDSKERERLEAENLALEEENRRLFSAIHELNSKTRQLRVDMSSGRPVLARISVPESSVIFDDVLVSSQLGHMLTLKEWLETDACQSVAEPEAPLKGHGNRTDASTSTVTDANINAPSVTLSTPAGNALVVDEAIASDEGGISTGDAPLCLRCATHCVHRQDAEALSRQIVELKLQLHYLFENTKLALDGGQFAVVMENTKLKTRVEEIEFQANLCTVACNQLEMKNRACETRLSNQETHITCLQNSLQEYQALFKQQIVMSQEKCRLLTDELEFYKKLAKCSQQNYQYFGASSSLRQQSISGNRVTERKSYTLPLASSGGTASCPSPSKEAVGGNLETNCRITTGFAGASVASDGTSPSNPGRLILKSADPACASTRNLASFNGGSPSKDSAPTSALVSLFARTASSPELQRSSNQNGSPPPATVSPPAPVARTSFTLAADYRSNPMLF